jgi:hypothetical protein
VRNQNSYGEETEKSVKKEERICRQGGGDLLAPAKIKTASSGSIET